MNDTIQKIYHHLLLNMVYFTDTGLYYGKTGCLLFFSHFSLRFKNDIYDEIVSEIIDDIFSKVENISALSMQYGLCGIGWGVEYLLQNQLMEGNSDEVLAELDYIIFNQDVKIIESHPDYASILHYVVVRLTSSCGDSEKLPFPESFLAKLFKISNHPSNLTVSNLPYDANIIRKVLDKGRFKEKAISITEDMFGKASINEFPLIPLGLCNGLSGLGIKLILES